MDKLEGTITSHYQKLAIGLIIGALLVGGLLLFLWRYSSVLSGMSQQAVKNPLQQDAISLTQVKEDYEASFSSIIKGYLNSDPSSSNFAGITTRVKQQILDLKVPAIYKDSHLSTVLILSDIESLLATGGSEKIGGKISELKEVDKQFLSAIK